MQTSPTALVSITSDIPTFHGVLKTVPEDFHVEEIPAYLPCGTGEHLYLWIEKRDISHDELVRRVAQRFGVDSRSIGAAGMKDRRAVTRQWLSVHQISGRPEDAVGSIDDAVEVLEASRHVNKLRTGHLVGNRFTIRVREVDESDAPQRASRTFEVLERLGVPNYFGAQRFGRDDRTLELGVAWIDGERPHPLRKNRWLRRLAVSAVQSAVFNRVLTTRLNAGTASKALPGDRLNRVAARGQLVVTGENQAEAQRGIDAGELVATGPLPGPKMYDVYDEVAEIEAAAIADFGLSKESFDRLGKLAPGTRRDLFVRFLDAPTVESDAPSALTVGFSLPSGAYATVVLGELIGLDYNAWEAT